MKKFCLSFSIICIILGLTAIGVLIWGVNQPDVTTSFIITMCLSIASLLINGSMFMWYYTDLR